MRPWTAKDVERLRGLMAAGSTYKAAARALGRSVPSVAGQVRRNGLLVGRAARLAERLAVLTRLHRAGLNLAAVARRIGVPPRYLYPHYRALGLTPHTLDPAERSRRSALAVRAKYGRTSGQLRRENDRAASAAAGWPPVTAAAARHLDIFYRLGPATVRQHQCRAGGSVSGSQHAVLGAVGRGHLIVLRPGGGSAPPVYDLAPAVRERRRAYLAVTTADIPA